MLRRTSIQICGFIILGLGLLTCACSKTEPWQEKDPEVVLKSFLIAAEYQNNEQVWNYLSEQNKQELQKRANEINKILNNNENPIDPARLIRFGHVISSTREYERFELRSNDEQNAEVAIVLHDKSEILVPLMRENQHWIVDLPLSQ